MLSHIYQLRGNSISHQAFTSSLSSGLSEKNRNLNYWQPSNRAQAFNDYILDDQGLMADCRIILMLFREKSVNRRSFPTF